MKISAAGLDLIKQFEDFRGTAYLCPGHVWTIGYGSTLKVKPGDVITLEQAEKRLIVDVARFEAAVNEAVRVPITQGQFDALVSFAFNVGIGAFKRSRLLTMVNAGKLGGAAREFSKWVRVRGNVLPGLVARRAAEQELFEQRMST
jgi:lysozyme